MWKYPLRSTRDYSQVVAPRLRTCASSIYWAIWYAYGTCPIPKATRHWLHFTPERFVIALLCVEALLWLSESFHAFAKGWAMLTTIACVGVADTEAAEDVASLPYRI